MEIFIKRIILCLATNKIMQIIFSILYSNLIFFILNFGEDMDMIDISYYFFEKNNNEETLKKCKTYAEIMSLYLQKVENKQYYGSIDHEKSEILISSFYIHQIINKDYIFDFLTKLNWNNINKDYNNESDKLIHITKQYLEYITVEKKKIL